MTSLPSHSLSLSLSLSLSVYLSLTERTCTHNTGSASALPIILQIICSVLERRQFRGSAPSSRPLLFPIKTSKVSENLSAEVYSPPLDYSTGSPVHVEHQTWTPILCLRDSEFHGLVASRQTQTFVYVWRLANTPRSAESRKLEIGVQVWCWTENLKMNKLWKPGFGTTVCGKPMQQLWWHCTWTLILDFLHGCTS